MAASGQDEFDIARLQSTRRTRLTLLRRNDRNQQDNLCAGLRIQILIERLGARIIGRAGADVYTGCAQAVHSMSKAHGNCRGPLQNKMVSCIRLVYDSEFVHFRRARMGRPAEYRIALGAVREDHGQVK